MNSTLTDRHQGGVETFSRISKNTQTHKYKNTQIQIHECKYIMTPTVTDIHMGVESKPLSGSERSLCDLHNVTFSPWWSKLLKQNHPKYFKGKNKPNIKIAKTGVQEHE